jgi:hypothetical protein
VEVGTDPVLPPSDAFSFTSPQTISYSPDNSFGAIISVGWREPVLTKDYLLLRVTFDEITIKQDRDSNASGEWNNLWVAGNGHWIELSGPSISRSELCCS